MREEPRDRAGGGAPDGDGRAATEASALLARIGDRLGDRVLLWRGAGLAGSDVDLVADARAHAALARLLSSAGLRPHSSDPGHVAWSLEDAGNALPIDVLHGDAWPSYYPSLAGVRSRAEATVWGIPAASDSDRTLMAAAEALVGRPLAKVASRMRELASTPGANERTRAVARREGLEELAALAADPDRLAARARRGRLPYSRVLPLVATSRAARAALATRVRTRIRGLRRFGVPHGGAGGGPHHSPLLITVSGMDGSGKSTAAALLRDELEARGVPVVVAWARLGMKGALPDRLAGLVRTLLRRRGSIADPLASGGPGVQEVRDPRETAGRRRLVSWAWILFVALVSVRSGRRAARARRRGRSVVCDRWTTDALVDLEVRYGPHRAGARAVRLLMPRPDLELVIAIDARTAARRKPGDQAESVLHAMEVRYASWLLRRGIRAVDGTRSREEVAGDLIRHLDAVLDGGGRPR